MKSVARSVIAPLIAGVVGLLVTIGPGLAGEDEAPSSASASSGSTRTTSPAPCFRRRSTRSREAKFPVADVHCHWTAEVAPEALVADMDRLGIAYAVNLSGGWGEQLDALLERYKAFAPDRFEILVNVDFSEIDAPTSERSGQAFSRRRRRKGRRGSRSSRTSASPSRTRSGAVVTIDDPRLDPIWAKCGELGMPVLIHSADPLAFFEPIDRYNERLMQLGRHPDWSFYGPLFPDREEILAQRNRVLAKHPGTRFIGAHLGGNAEDLAALGRVLDRSPELRRGHRRAGGGAGTTTLHRPPLLPEVPRPDPVRDRPLSRPRPASRGTARTSASWRPTTSTSSTTSTTSLPRASGGSMVFSCPTTSWRRSTS